MVDITSLKVRLARLRLGSEFEDKNPELADPVTIDRKKKKKQKKAAQDPYNQYTKNPNKRKKNNKLTRSDQKRGKIDMKKLRAHQKKNKIQGPNYEKGYKVLDEYFDSIPEEERHAVDKRLKKYGL